MYRILLCLFLCFSFLAPKASSAANKNVVTGMFKVEGTCDQCKKRIEDAAYVKGVKFAEWDKDTHTLTVKYDSSKTNPDKILEHIAKAGHDNELIKASKEDYAHLPSCCRYKDGVKKH